MRARLTLWSNRARALKTEVAAVALAYHHPRTPWYARVVAVCVVAYALSPIDLIPDPIPILGYLDDLVLLPLGIAVAVRLLPRDVLAECRRQAQDGGGTGQPTTWLAAGVIILVWLLMGVLVGRWILAWWRSA